MRNGSILGRLLFNIFIYELFLFTNDIDIATYPADNTPYAKSSKTNLAIVKPQQCSGSLFTWLQNNGIKSNADKCHFLVSTKVWPINNVVNNNKFKRKINRINIERSPQEKLLGVILDDQLNFKSLMSNLCKKVSRKLNALARISSFMDLLKRRVIMKIYVNSQLCNCLLVWMIYSRSINNEISRFHKRPLKIVYKDKFSSFGTPLEKYKALKSMLEICKF